MFPEKKMTDEMAQIASGVKIPGDLGERFLRVQRRTLPSVLDRRTIEACLVEIDENDWRFPFVQYLKNPKASTPRRIRLQALNYVLL